MSGGKKRRAREAAVTIETEPVEQKTKRKTRRKSKKVEAE